MRSLAWFSLLLPELAAARKNTPSGEGAQSGFSSPSARKFAAAFLALEQQDKGDEGHGTEETEVQQKIAKLAVLASEETLDVQLGNRTGEHGNQRVFTVDMLGRTGREGLSEAQSCAPLKTLKLRIRISETTVSRLEVHVTGVCAKGDTISDVTQQIRKT